MRYQSKIQEFEAERGEDGDWVVQRLTDGGEAIVSDEEFHRLFFPKPLTKAPMTPIRDLSLCRRREREKMGSFYLPDESKQKHNQVCEVLAVGPGAMLDNGTIRPAPCRPGDVIFTTPGDGFRVVVEGEELWLFEAIEIVGIFLDEKVEAHGDDHC